MPRSSNTKHPRIDLLSSKRVPLDWPTLLARLDLRQRAIIARLCAEPTVTFRGYVTAWEGLAEGRRGQRPKVLTEMCRLLHDVVGLTAKEIVVLLDALGVEQIGVEGAEGARLRVQMRLSQDRGARRIWKYSVEDYEDRG